MQKFCTAVILAGGTSSRMGFDKQLIEIDKKNLVITNIEKLKSIFEHIVVVTNEPLIYSNVDVEICSDEYKGFGPIAGVHIGLAKSKSEFVYFMACDMPIVDKDSIIEMMGIANSTSGVMYKSDGFIEPFPCFVNINMLSSILDILQKQQSMSLYKLFSSSDVKFLEVNSIELFTNLNTKEELHMFLTKTMKIQKYKSSIVEDTCDLVICEHQFEIKINNESYVTLMCSPENLKELIVGFLYSEGIICGYSEIKNITISRKYCNVVMHDTLSYESNSKGQVIATRVITTGCGRQRAINYPLSVANPLELIKNSGKISSTDILTLINSFSKGSKLFFDTGGVHSCALATNTEIIQMYDDVGRHNALDKIIGYILINNIDVKYKILLTTGRISSEMASKVINIGIPYLVSKSAPTDLAVNLAIEYNLNLVGFARGNRLNIYAGTLHDNLIT